MLARVSHISHPYYLSLGIMKFTGVVLALFLAAGADAFAPSSVRSSRALKLNAASTAPAVEQSLATVQSVSI